MTQHKTRSNATQITVKDNRRLSFYAAVWSQETVVRDFAQPYGVKMRYREVILPNAFDQYLASGGEVAANVDHDSSRVFASRTSGELLLQSDSHGLFASTEVPRNELGDGILREVDAGRLRGASVRMPLDGMKERWTGEQADPLCEILSSNLADVCITQYPAYEGAAVLRNDLDKRIQDYFTRLKLIKTKFARMTGK